MSVGDVFELAITWKSDESPYVAVCTPKFRQENALILDTEGEDLVGAFRDKCESAMAACITSTLRLVRYTVSPIPGTGSTYALDLGVTGPVGARAGDRLPPRVAAILSFRTATPGKRGRGRMYLPPASEGDNTLGRPTADLQSALNAFGETMFADMLAGGLEFANWQWVVRSDKDNISRPVTQYIARDYWGSQRDRTRIF